MSPETLDGNPRRGERIDYHCGRVEVITGPSGSGKTDELIRRCRRARFANKTVQVFTASSFGSGSIVSKSGKKIEGTHVSSAQDLGNLIEPGADVIVVDEIQWVQGDFAGLVNKLANKGKRVILAGVVVYPPDSNQVDVIMAQAEDVVVLKPVEL